MHVYRYVKTCAYIHITNIYTYILMHFVVLPPFSMHTHTHMYTHVHTHIVCMCMCTTSK